MDSFEIAHALYTEEPVNVYYLDHDPVAAARAHCDRHVVKMVLEAAQLLSTAWHYLLNPMYRALDESGDYDAAFGRVVTPARSGAQVVWGGGDPFYNTLTGDSSYWTLCRQKIFSAAHPEHPSAVWARTTLGNYRWLHSLGLALCGEYTFRYRRRHAAEPVLWTLELAPPCLEGEQTEPPPAMPGHCKVEVGGYWDSVASYRQYYVQEKQPLLVWTRRGPPAWLRNTGEGYALVD